MSDEEDYDDEFVGEDDEQENEYEYVQKNKPKKNV
jgi:hypothetical protein